MSRVLLVLVLVAYIECDAADDADEEEEEEEKEEEEEEEEEEEPLCQHCFRDFEFWENCRCDMEVIDADNAHDGGDADFVVEADGIYDHDADDDADDADDADNAHDGDPTDTAQGPVAPLTCSGCGGALNHVDELGTCPMCFGRFCFAICFRTTDRCAGCQARPPRPSPFQLARLRHQQQHDNSDQWWYPATTSANRDRVPTTPPGQPTEQQQMVAVAAAAAEQQQMVAAFQQALEAAGGDPIDDGADFVVEADGVNDDAAIEAVGAAAGQPAASSGSQQPVAPAPIPTDELQGHPDWYARQDRVMRMLGYDWQDGTSLAAEISVYGCVPYDVPWRRSDDADDADNSTSTLMARWQRRRRFHHVVDDDGNVVDDGNNVDDGTNDGDDASGTGDADDVDDSNDDATDDDDAKRRRLDQWSGA